MTMEKRYILINSQLVEYNFKRSKRARNLSLSIDCEAGVVATLPWWTSEKTMEKFILQKGKWILKNLGFLKSLKLKYLPKPTKRDYLAKKEEVRKLVYRRLEHFNQHYHFKYKKIYIKRHRSRWGSCSQDKNLNFNYRLIYLPKILRDYIIVHELCHTRQFNHSAKFWQLVERCFPNYRILKKRLEKYAI